MLYLKEAAERLAAKVKARVKESHLPGVGLR